MGVRDRDPPEYSHFRGPLPWQTRPALRHPLCRCSGLYPAGRGAAEAGANLYPPRSARRMSAKEVSPRLGRGLAALLGDIAVQPPETPQTGVIQIALDLLEPNPFQPRTGFPDEAMQELAESIRVRGILQPLLVRAHPDEPGRYQIIAGERRWRA